MKAAALGVAGAAAFLVLAIALVSPATARRRMRVFSVNDVHALYGVLFGYDDERYTLTGVDESERIRRSILLGERLGLSASGNVFHPKFWRWKLALDVLALQDWFANADDKLELTNSTRVEFDLDNQLLSGRPYPVRLFARRKTQIVRRDFVRNFDVTTTNFGGDVLWRIPGAPLRISYSRILNEYGRTSEELGDDSFDQIFADMRHTGTRQTASLEYRFLDYENQAVSDLDFRVHDLLGYLVWYPGQSPKRPYRFDARLRYLSRESGVDRQEARTWLLFTAKVLPELQTTTRYQFTTWTTNGIRTVQNFAQADVRYRLYKSLFFGVLGRGLMDFIDGNRRIEGLYAADITYRKRILQILTMSHSFQITGSRAEGGAANDLLNATEEIPLKDVSPAMLRERNIDLGSIIVLDATTLQSYRMEKDYEVRREAERTFLIRSGTSKIPDGATVRVTYAFRIEGQLTRSSLDRRYIGKIWTDFSDHLRLRGEVSEAWTVIRDVGAPARDERYEILNAGIDAYAGPVSLSADYRRNRSLGFQSDETVGSASLDLSPSTTFRLVLGTRIIRLLIQDPYEDRRIYEGFTEGAWIPFSAVSVVWNWRYHREQGGPSDGDFLNGQITASWRIRELVAKASYQLQMDFREDQKYRNHSVFMSFGRTF